MTRRSLSRRELLTGSAVTAGASVLGSSAVRARAAPATSQKSDLALINGKILTLDDRNTIASAMAIRNGRIAEIGKRVGPATRILDLKGATVIPGLIDAQDQIYFALANPGYEARDIELATSMNELLGAITERAGTVPAGEFITCNGGWGRKALVEKRLPTLAELDAAAPNHPVWLAENQTEDAWINPEKYPPLPAIVNSRGLAFLEKRGVTSDHSTGLVPWAESTAALQKAQSEEDRRRSMNDAIDFAVGHGLTMIHDYGFGVTLGGGSYRELSLEASFPYVLDMWRDKTLKLRFRVREIASGIEALRARMVNSIKRLGDDVLRLNGFGGVADQSQVLENFTDAGKLIAKHGWNAHVHSVVVDKPGDSTLDKFNTAGCRAVNAVYPLKDLRWSLNAVNYITAELVQELKEMGVGVCGQAWQYAVDRESVPMGPPWRMLLDSGIHLGAGSDGTGTSGANPWITVYYMTTGRLNTGEIGNPGQTISRMDALKIHTRGSAWLSFDDHHLGTLEIGKLADLAVLSDDPLTVSDDKLRRITSTLTLQAGKVVHQKA